MTANRLPGLLGISSLQPPIDPGTMARLRSAAPTQVGTGSSPRPPPAASLAELRVLRPGMRGPDVAWLQNLLNQRVQPPPRLRMDGDFGPATERVLRGFQLRAGVHADGVAGPATWLALQTLTVTLAGVDDSPTTQRRAPTATPSPTGSPATTATPRPQAAGVEGTAPPCPWMDVAEAEIGTAEVAGASHSSRILAYHATTTLRAQTDEIAWCSSFVNWVIRECGLQGTNSAAAASWISWGAGCALRRGAIVVIRNARAANSSLTTSGNHVGFLVESTDAHYVVLGGNQSDQVKESRFRKASWTLRGCRWPAG